MIGTAPYFDEPFSVGFDVGGFEVGLMPTERIPPQPPAAEPSVGQSSPR